MRTLLLNHPGVQLYLLFFTALIIANVIAASTRPENRKDDKIPEASQPGSCRPRITRWGTPGSLSVQDLESCCRKEYAMRFAQALKRIRRSEYALPGKDVGSPQRRTPAG